MNDSDILKRLIQAEQKAKALISDAEKIADKKIEDINRAKQDEFRTQREVKHADLEDRLKKFKFDQEERRKNDLSSFRNTLAADLVDEEEASRVVKDILKVL